MVRRAVSIALFLLSAGCGGLSSQQGLPQGAGYRPGERVYVCGCLTGCCACNAIARVPGGRCDCNHPLRPATVVRSGPDLLAVRLDGGREKRFFLHAPR